MDQNDEASGRWQKLLRSLYKYMLLKSFVIWCWFLCVWDWRNLHDLHRLACIDHQASSIWRFWSYSIWNYIHSHAPDIPLVLDRNLQVRAVQNHRMQYLLVQSPFSSKPRVGATTDRPGKTANGSEFKEFRWGRAWHYHLWSEAKIIESQSLSPPGNLAAEKCGETIATNKNVNGYCQ